MNAAIVAVPTLITAEVLMPASIVGARERQLDVTQDRPAFRPSDCAACLTPRLIWVQRRVCVFRTIGSSAYSASAMNAGIAPMRPVIGISKASSASAGIVCTTPVMPRIRPSLAGRRAARIPSGMPSAMLAASEANTSSKCSSVSRAKSGPNSFCQKPLPDAVCASLAGAFAVDAIELAGGAARRQLCARKSLATADEVFALELGFGIHPPHRGIVDPAFEAPERGEGARQALRQVGAVEQYGIVAREIVADRR